MNDDLNFFTSSKNMPKIGFEVIARDIDDPYEVYDLDLEVLTS